MAIERVTAVSTAWTELPRGSSTAVIVQNQGYGDVYLHVAAAAPGSLDAASLLMPRPELTGVGGIATGDKLWVRAFSDACAVVIYR